MANNTYHSIYLLKKSLAGFSFLELLVALVILSIGLTLHLKVQTASLSKIQQAANINQASIIADNLANKILSNYQYQNDYLLEQNWIRNLQSWIPKSCIGIDNYCNHTQMIEYQIHSIRKLAANNLPKGQVYLEQEGIFFNILVSWQGTTPSQCKLDNTHQLCVFVKILAG